MKVAEEGIKSLKESVDAIITIPNQKLFELEDADMSFKDAYKKVDEILLRAVRGISDIISTPGYQNVDFADVKAVMHEKGVTLMGTGEAKGENRAEEAARKTLTSPLLDNISIHGATGVLYNITASSTLTLKEIGRIAEIINANAAPDARIKFGIVDDESMGDLFRVTVIATGFKEGSDKKVTPRSMHKFVTPATPLTPATPRAHTPSIPTPPPALVEETKDFVDFDEGGRSFYLGSKAHKSKPTNITEYVNESSIPNMLHDPENVDDLLDVPSFQRYKSPERRGK
jgi:cell division protein FtsZ